jgi:hypothetical protein
MLTDWILRLRSLLRREVVEQELVGELRFHLERLIDSHIQAAANGKGDERGDRCPP